MKYELSRDEVLEVIGMVDLWNPAGEIVHASVAKERIINAVIALYLKRTCTCPEKLYDFGSSEPNDSTCEYPHAARPQARIMVNNQGIHFEHEEICAKHKCEHVADEGAFHEPARTEQPTPLDRMKLRQRLYDETKLSEEAIELVLPWLIKELPPAAPVAVVEPRREIELIPTIWDTFRVVVGEIYVFEEEAAAKQKYDELLAEAQRTEGAGQNDK